MLPFTHSPFSPNHMPQRLPLDRAAVFVDGLDHPECVAVHPDGSVWAGGEAGQIYRIAPDGGHVEEVARTGGFTLGIAFSPDASWLAVCDLRQQCLWRLDLASGALSEFARGVDGHRFVTPNFAVFAADGTLYVSDSGTAHQNDGRVLRFDADHSGRGEVWHEGPFDFANGMALAPDGRALVVVSSWLPGVERVEIRPDGSAGARSLIAQLPRTVPDGCAFDADGALYVSCYAPARIYRIAPGGEPEVFIEDWGAHTLCNPTNIAFGGPGFDQLFAANLGRWHLTRIDAGVRGAPLACHAR